MLTFSKANIIIFIPLNSFSLKIRTPIIENQNRNSKNLISRKSQSHLRVCGRKRESIINKTNLKL